ncbi:MAG: MerR family transcriptional regulator [Clostridiaceae bacterium]|nr:MerR family transcriptional regulator [Clostridiaceae bacterium]
MPKPEGLFSIGEIATACGISINALRFYETKALIKPAHTDPDSGYRYYSRRNMLRLRAVLRFKDAGLSLPEIKEYLDGDMDSDVKIAALVERRNALSMAIENLRIMNTPPSRLFVHKISLPERLCLCRTIEAKDGEAALLAIGEFYDELLCNGVHISREWPEFCEYPDHGLLKGEFKVTDFVITACLPVDKKTAPQEAILYPAGNALVVNYRGRYYEIWKAYEALSVYIQEHGYTSTGYPQEIYLETDADGSVQIDSANNLTRVIIPI